MKITGTKSYIKVEYKGRTAWFNGELGMPGFYAIASSMRWLPPFDKNPVTEAERTAVMKAVTEEVKNNKYKVFFTNDHYEVLNITTP
jgi:hypothetical protein